MNRQVARLTTAWPPSEVALPSVLKVAGVGKSYQRQNRNVTALTNINLDIAQGSFVTIVGRSGCGKSTLLRLLGGLLHPTEGSISLDGVEVIEPPPSARFVFQDYGQSLFPWKTVDENVRFGIQYGCEPSSGDHAAQLEQAHEALKLVGLSHALGRYPWELSGGMQQRVAIARALAARPQLLLMDEPFSSVDALSRQQLQDTILNIWSQLKNTVVFVTHDIDEAVYLSDRVIVLNPKGDGVLADFPIATPRPRHPLASREDSTYLQARRAIFEMVMS